MKYYSQQNVLEAALDRIRYLFQEFPVLGVNISGGKDSTVTLHLALQVAEEQGRLPLPVLFIDQEAEWEAVITYMRQLMADPRIQPYWLQVPLKLFNATSSRMPWLQCWQPGAQWIRQKEPTSVHDNLYGTDRFTALFDAFLRTTWPQQKACLLAGVRAEESPGRLNGLTVDCTYKEITWGRVNTKRWEHYTFYPLYDWSYTDIWKAIHSHGWPYCSLYDAMYQYGLPVQQMRVSNVHHETAVKTLFFLQEIEPETWNRIQQRLPGIHTAGSLQQDFLRIPQTLPPMFVSWEAYRDYLLENLITDPVARRRMAQQFAFFDAGYTEDAKADLLRTQFSMILNQDYHGTKLRNSFVP